MITIVVSATMKSIADLELEVITKSDFELRVVVAVEQNYNLVYKEIAFLAN